MSIRFAAYYSIATQILIQVISLASIVIIARLLIPEELGIYAIAGSVVFVAMEFQNLGTQTYLLREESLSDDVIATCFNLSLLTSWGLCLTVYLSSDYVAEFYGLPALDSLLEIFSISFFITPFIVVHRAMMTREFRFRQLMIVDVTAKIIVFGTTIFLILNDAGILGIAFGQLAGISSSFLLINMLTTLRIKYGLSFAKGREIFFSGINYSFANVMERLSLLSSDLVIGKIGSPLDVAMMSRGIGFMDFLRNSILMGVEPVILPMMTRSKITASPVDAIRSYYESISLVNVLLLPAILVAAVSSDPIIRLFFGDQWQGSAILVPGIAMWIAFRSFHCLAPSLFSSLKREDLRLYRELLTLLAIVLALLGGYAFSLYWTSWALAAAGCFEFIVTSYLLARFSGFSVREYWRSQWRTLFVALMVPSVVFLTRNSTKFSAEEYILESAMVVMVSLMVWLLAVVLIRHPMLKELITLWQQFSTSKNGIN